MKLNIDLEGIYGYDGDSVEELINTAIRDELLAFAKRMAKEEIKKHEAKIRKDIEKMLQNINVKDLISK